MVTYDSSLLEKKILEFTIKFGIAGNIIGGLSNFIQRPILINFLLPFLMTLYLSTVYILIKNKNNYRFFVHLTLMIINFIYTPFMWFLTGGTMSAFPFYMIAFITITVIVTKQKYYKFYLISFSSMFLLLVYLEDLFPNLMLGYSSGFSRDFDISLSFIIVILYLSYNVRFLKDNFEKEHNNFLNISVTDYLSNLYNRRFVISELSKMKEKQMNNLSVLMLDFDNFKKINDKFGHQKGDEIISDFGNILKNNIRLGDIAGRYGGDEFILLLKDTNYKEALKIAERINKQFLINNESYKNIPLTLSIGINSHTKHKNHLEIIKSADDNLYKAKRKGKNLII